MRLSDNEKRMTDGLNGQAQQRAIDLLIRLGESFDAERLVDVSRAHVSYDACPLDFWDMMTDGLRNTGQMVTTHPSFQPDLWESWGLPLAHKFKEAHDHRVATIRRLGWMLTETCAEYQIGITAATGDVISMGGSCIQVSNNSLFGARIDRMGILVSLAAAVCGKTPLMGLLLPENRFARHLVDLAGLDMEGWEPVHYQCLGYYIGSRIPGFQPVAVKGIPPGLAFESARSLVVPMPTSGAVTLCHINGTTPEAPDEESALGGRKPEHVHVIRPGDLEQTWNKLNVWDDNTVEHVCFGCPHASIEDIGRIAALLEGRKCAVPLLIGASNRVAEMAGARGWTGAVVKAGGYIAPICPALVNPFARKDIAGDKKAKSVATNSARAAHYLASDGTMVFLGTTEECVQAALTGKWKGGKTIWK